MAEEEINNDEDVKEEKEKLKDLGVSETKPDEEKPAFRGFQ